MWAPVVRDSSCTCDFPGYDGWGLRLRVVFRIVSSRSHSTSYTITDPHEFSFPCLYSHDWFPCYRRSCPLYALIASKPLISCMYKRKLICTRGCNTGRFLMHERGREVLRF